MKIMKIAMGAAVVALMATVSQADTVIYSETFDGDGSGNIFDKAPTVGGNTWDAKNVDLVSDNGTMAGFAGGALLPFSPETNEVYTLSMDLNHTGTKFIGLGFTRDGISTNVVDTSNRFQNRGGIAWFKYGNGTDIFTWGGLNEDNEISNDAVYAAGAVELTIMIDTTGDGTSFKANFFIDGVTITDGYQPVAVAVDDINFVGITGQGAAGTGVVDNFELSLVEETPPVTEVGNLSIVVSGSELGIGWYGEIGGSYNLQISEDLTDETWGTITNIAGENAEILVLDDIDKTNAFYRVELDSPE